jgi:protein transport protein SEC24
MHQPGPQQFQNGQQFQQPIMNSGGAPYQPINSQPNIHAGFQNMNLGQPNLPVGINLMAGPPNPESFHTPVPRQDLTSLSVTPSLLSNAPLEYKRCTLNAIPNKDDLEDKCKLPFGLLITPFRHLHPGESEIPIIQSPQIVRCRRCRAYINPWVQFVEQGSRWKCNMCYLNNDVPSFFDWDGDNRVRIDRLQRPELTNGVVEYIAPQEYMVRPPQPVVMVFVIDVSIGAVQSGMLATGCKSILDSLDRIPNDDDRTKVAFITFDDSLHFYNLSASNLEPQMMVVADLSEVFLPAPSDLLVSLSECRAGIEALLVKLPIMFGHSNQTLSAMGKALKFAEKLIGSIGGKIICLQHALPNHDEGALKMREDPKLRGTPKESQLLSAAITFYKNFAVDCSPSQISIDLFLFNPQYQDVATLSGCVKFTGGALYYYQGFNAARHEDAVKFGTELSHLLTRPLGLESVLRIRAPKGIRMNCFHGNFFLRSTDLLSLPNVNPDNSYTVECMLTEELKVPSVCFQTALLYTSTSGDLF